MRSFVAEISDTTSEHTSATKKTKDVSDLEQRIWIAGETGPDVVKKCIEKLKMLSDKGVFPDDKDFMERLAFVMSRNGETPGKTYTDGGIWQVSMHAFKDTTKEDAHERLARKCQKLQDMLQIDDWRRVKRTDLEKPMYSALAARLYLSNTPEPIPPSHQIEKQQAYWWRFYMFNHEAKDDMREDDFKEAMEHMK